MSDEEGIPQFVIDAWANCAVADCCWKVCLGLSDTQCFAHHFKLRMNDEGLPIFPNAAIKKECYRLLDAANGRAGGQ